MKDYFQPKRQVNRFEEVYRVSSKKREVEFEREFERKRMLEQKKKERSHKRLSL